MLKLAWALRSGPPKLSPRSSSWCIPNHQSISACSNVATATQVKDAKATDERSANDPHASKSKHSMVRLVFDSLSEIDISPETKVRSLLGYVDKDEVGPNRAKRTIETLRRWVADGKIEAQHFENTPQYLKLCEIIRQKSQETAQKAADMKRRDTALKNGLEFRPSDQTYSTVRTMPAEQVLGILTGLVVKQARDKPLLTAIATNITRNAAGLRMKDIADVLYGVAILNFSDETLVKELCSHLQLSLSAISKSAIIGSIVTSLGMLRYRDTALLDLISKWVVENKDVLRTQDLCALIMTLAVVGHNPSNWEVLFEKLVATLQETDMTKSSEWLDVVWSLTLLDRVTSAQLESVLNTKFIDKLMDGGELAHVKKQKLLNINAAAKFLINNYNGSLLPNDCGVEDAPMMRSKSKQDFVRAITDALANLFPSKDHFRTNVVTGTGFTIDVEFFLNEKCAPLRLDTITQHKDAIRVAIVANSYHDYCMGEKTLLGQANLHQRLLRAQGYQVVDISHEEYHPSDKLLTRITYINDRIKSIVT